MLTCLWPPPSLTNAAVVLQAVADVLVDERAELAVGAVLAAAAAVLLVAAVVRPAPPRQDVPRPGDDLVRARRLLPHRPHSRHRHRRLVFGGRRRWQVRGGGRARGSRPVLTALLFFRCSRVGLDFGGEKTTQ